MNPVAEHIMSYSQPDTIHDLTRVSKIQSEVRIACESKENNMAVPSLFNELYISTSMCLLSSVQKKD